MLEKKKVGVALVSLVIVIIIIALLATIPIMSFGKLTKESELAKFAENMTVIEDAVSTYYLGIGKWPLKVSTEYTNEQVVELADSEKRAALSAEMLSNGDNNKKFYMVDVNKISLKQSAYGITANSEKLFMNEDGTNVYYIDGVKIYGEWHFSYNY